MGKSMENEMETWTIDCSHVRLNKDAKKGLLWRLKM